MLLKHHGDIKEEVKLVGMEERAVNLFGQSFLRILGTGSLFGTPPQKQHIDIILPLKHENRLDL